jgi:uncharacterized membrane protein YccF (DUF307 family)
VLFATTLGAVFGMGFGLLGALVGGIQGAELVDHRLTTKREVLSNVRYGTYYGLAAGLIFAVSNALFAAMSGSLWRDPPVTVDSWLPTIVCGLATGAASGYLLRYGKARGEVEREKPSAPNEGIRQSARYAVATALYVAVGGYAVFALLWFFVGIARIFLIQALPLEQANLSASELQMWGLWPYPYYAIAWEALRLEQILNSLLFGAMLAVSVGLIGAFLAGGLTVARHLLLRTVLWLFRRTPLNFARFVDYGAALALLFKAGGSYRFWHDLTRDYFAALTPTDIERLSRTDAEQ